MNARKYIGEEYVYLDESHSYCTSLDSIPTEVPLPYALFLKFQGKIILFRKAGDSLTTARLVELRADGIDCLYIRRDDWNAFIESIERFIEPGMPTEKYISHVRSLLLAYGKVLETQAIVKPGILGKAKALMEVLIEVVHSSPPIATQLIRRYSDPNVYYNNHNLNVAIYSLIIGTHLKFGRADLESLTLSSLFHNLGNLFIPDQILYKPDTLSYEEFSRVQPHTDMGAKILASLNLPDEVIQTAMQHHERIDGKGYPHQYRGPQIHFFAKICSIADVYDALTCHRPYRPAMTPKEALETMSKMEGKFDPRLFTIASRKKSE